MEPSSLRRYAARDAVVFVPKPSLDKAILAKRESKIVDFKELWEP